MPAEQTSTSMRPIAAALAFAAASTLAKSATSTLCVSVPAGRRALAFASAAASRSQRLSLAPPAASLCAMAKPMPTAPPVMTAARLLKSS